MTTIRTKNNHTRTRFGINALTVFVLLSVAGFLGSYLLTPVTAEAASPNPPLISGSGTGQTGTSYTFTFSATDPDGDTVRYEVDWDNNGTVERTDSGEDQYTWKGQALYTFNVDNESSVLADGYGGTWRIARP